uniref:PNPLA domain-containing protein n=1 Tax=viral metagenome TaxID=1070528 RepID=A0A6C0LY11_9ZZZZ
MFDTLVISGGGIKGFSTLGAVQFFHGQGMLDSITTYCGCSIGSVLCLLLNCGYTPLEVLARLSTIDLMHLMKTASGMFNVLKTFGFINIDDFATQIEILVRKRFDRVPTLEELYRLTNKKIIIAVTNATLGKAEYLDYENSPGLSCIEAIKMSCNLPLVFQRVTYNGALYVDGGLLDNFPILYVDKKGEWNSILGIKTTIGSSTTSHSPDNLPSYLYRLLFIPIGEIERMRLETLSDRCYVVSIPVDNTSVIDFAIDTQDRKDMFNGGYAKAKSIWETNPYEWI